MEKIKNFFQKLLKNKCEIKYSTDLKQIIKKLQIDLKDGNNKKKQFYLVPLQLLSISLIILRKGENTLIIFLKV